jgi:hypothetical protein
MAGLGMFLAFVTGGKGRVGQQKWMSSGKGEEKRIVRRGSTGTLVAKALKQRGGRVGFGGKGAEIDPPGLLFSAAFSQEHRYIRFIN